MIRVRVGCLKRKLNNGRIAFYLRWSRLGDGNRKIELAFKTEEHVTATRLKTVWQPRMADAIYRKERELNGDARDFTISCAVRDAKDLYVLAMDGELAASTVDRHVRVLGSFVDYNEDRGGPAIMSGLRQKHIAQWRDWMIEKSMAGTTINTYLADLGGWFKWCVGESYAADNYAAKVNRASAIETKAAGLPIRGAAGLWELLAHLEPPYDSDYHVASVGLLACSGLRMDEAANLRFDTAWDKDTDTLVVGVEMSETRTKKHRRVIPISDCLRSWLMMLEMIQDGPFIIGRDRGYSKITSQARRWLKPLGCSPKHLRQWFRTALETTTGVKNFALIDDLLGHRTSRVRSAYTTTEYVEHTRKIADGFNEWLMRGKDEQAEAVA